MPVWDVGLSIVAHLYNTSAAAHSGRIMPSIISRRITLKTKRRYHPIGVLVLSAVYPPGLYKNPGRTIPALGIGFYNVRDIYKTADEVADTLWTSSPRMATCC